jgi:hypothetical protein
MDWEDRLNGICAIASLLHVPRVELPCTFARFTRALSSDDVWCPSMKQGKVTSEAEGRTLADATKTELRDLLEAAGLSVSEIWLTGDVRPGLSDRWVNAIARRL